jgi:O-antigen ligase
MFIDYHKDFKSFLKSILLVFLASFPFILYNGFLFNATSSRSLNTVLLVQILMIFLGIYLFKNKSIVKIVKSPITISLSIFFIIMVVASVFGVDFVSSFWSKVTRTTGIFYFLHIGFLYLIFLSVFNNKEDIFKLLKVFVVSTALFSFLSAVGNEGFGLIFQNKEWQGLTFGNSTFAGMYILPSFVLSLYFIISKTIVLNKWFKYLLPFILIFNPFIFNFGLLRGEAFEGVKSLLGSAQASASIVYISIFGVLFFYLLEKIKNAKIKKNTIIVLVSCIFVLTIFISKSLLTKDSFVQNVYLSQSSAARPLVWDLSKQAISEKPLLGWGVDNFDIAYQKYYDNRVLELKNGGEAWFDRAHNIFIDQAIETGYLGLAGYILVFLSIFFCLMYVILKSEDQDYRLLGGVLFVYFLGHIFEIQTSFDTTVSYVSLVVLVSVSTFVYLETKSKYEQNIKLNKNIVAGIFVFLAIYMFFLGSVNIIKSQNANTSVRVVGSSAKRLEVYQNLFDTKMDKPAFLWATSNDIQRGIASDTSVLSDEFQREGLKEEVSVILNYYEEYIKEDNGNFRALLNMADFYIYQRLFDVDNLNRAHEILDRVIEINSSSPQPYWMKAVASLYQAKFKDAQMYAQKAYDLNPHIEESTRLKDYIEKSIKEFPEISLYSFKQI